MKHIMTTDPAVTSAQARALLRQWYLATPRTPRAVGALGGSPAAAGAPAGGSSTPGVVLDLARAGSGELEARAWTDDRAFLAWADGGGGASVIAAELKARSKRSVGSMAKAYCSDAKAGCWQSPSYVAESAC